ncbi:unnamed protein product [Strongylus vulgaris]|uniref:Uncharacterized protein n=1 Tax=Strongylus vulgaris TaxID=40348 RepID=A0A3P7LDD2_STRVU|nr:unnamed protein product [Strongylus vulgaris]
MVAESDAEIARKLSSAVDEALSTARQLREQGNPNYEPDDRQTRHDIKVKVRHLHSLLSRDCKDFINSSNAKRTWL